VSDTAVRTPAQHLLPTAESPELLASPVGALSAPDSTAIDVSAVSAAEDDRSADAASALSTPSLSPLSFQLGGRSAGSVSEDVAALGVPLSPLAAASVPTAPQAVRVPALRLSSMHDAVAEPVPAQADDSAAAAATGESGMPTVAELISNTEQEAQAAALQGTQTPVLPK
jgi:hypothetical protein